jgi:hypothetical protein
MMDNALIDILYTRSNVTNTMDFPVLSVAAKLDADTNWPELVDGFVQFLRGSGFFIDAEWLPQYKEHKEVHERARQFYKEWEASRDTTSEDEMGHRPIVGRGINSDELFVVERPRPTKKKKKKAKK